MAIPVIAGAFIIGVILARFFKFRILIPTCALAAVVLLGNSLLFETSLLTSSLEVVALITALQIGYVVGLAAHALRNDRRDVRNSATYGASIKTRAAGAKWLGHRRVSKAAGSRRRRSPSDICMTETGKKIEPAI